MTWCAALAAMHPTSNAVATDGRGVFLRPGNQSLFRVRTTLEVEGNVNVPENPLVSRKSRLRLPIKSDAVFDYEERLLHREADDSARTVIASERYYHEARSRGTLNKSTHDQQLRRSVRETIVRRDRLPEIIYAVDDYFQRGELELLRLPVSSVAVDELLPTTAVTRGSTYKPSNDAIGSVLNLTSLEACDVTAEVAELTEQSAKIRFDGKISGSVEGVPTVLRLVAKLTFDRQEQASTWLAMAIHETRDVGKAEPGFDVAATVKMIRQPRREVVALPAQRRPIDLLSGIPEERLYVDLQSEQLGFTMLMGREWRMMTDVPGTAMMRMVQNDRSIAQCDFRPLASLTPGQQWTLEALQAEVHQMLGEQLTEIVEADQRTSESGLSVLRVVAHGMVQEVPIRWVVLHFSDDAGRRLLATFTMEGDRVEAFAGSDVQLASTLSLRPKPADQPGESGENDPQNQQQPPENRPASEIAKSISGENSSDQVQSASDLR